ARCRTKHAGMRVFPALPMASIRPKPTLLLPTRRDLLCDFDCQLQRRRRLRTGNARLGSGACTFDKRPELQFQWFVVFDLDSVSPYLFSDARIDFSALILLIERELCVIRIGLIL